MQEQHRLYLDTVLIGAAGALTAQLMLLTVHTAQQLLLTGIAGYQPPALPGQPGPSHQIIGPQGLWLVPLVTTFGGLLAGLLVYGFSMESRGHGINTVIEAFHRSRSAVRARVPAIELLASALTIGSGGSAGLEGPAALINAGIGSVYATVLHRPERERRILLLVGMASSLGAVFRAPIGAALFASGVLYSGMDWETGVVLYTVLGGVAAFLVNGLFVGWQPFLIMPQGLHLITPDSLGLFALLGLLSGFVGVLMPTVFHVIRQGFEGLPVPPYFKPAIGGLATGIIALGLPQVLGDGYGWIQLAMNGQVALRLLVALVLAKTVAFSFTVGSGGVGGSFGPSLFIGAVLGAGLAALFQRSPAAFSAVGIASVLAAATRVPVATLLLVTEMTGSYQLFVPAALAIAVAYLSQVVLARRLRYKSLYQAQTSLRTTSPAHGGSERGGMAASAHAPGETPGPRQP